MYIKNEDMILAKTPISLYKLIKTFCYSFATNFTQTIQEIKPF
jgi:hypothetical protein